MLGDDEAWNIVVCLHGIEIIVIGVIVQDLAFG